VFEFVGKGKDFELTICGGGRYDGLIGQLGGKPAPGCGFGFGVERVLMMLAETPLKLAVPDAYVIFTDEAGSEAWRVAEQMRDGGLKAVLHAGGGSFKSQMKKADASGARFAIILGEDELREATVSLKPLRVAGEQQRLISSAALAQIKNSI
jgi:histidyl-tRNA synthetase